MILKNAVRFISIFILSTVVSSHLFSSESFVPSTFKVDIAQVYESAIPGGQKRENEGFILYRYPGHIRFEIQTPDRIVFVSDSSRTWYYTAPAIENEPGELNIGQATNSGLSAFFDALQNGLNTNPAYKVENKGLQTELTFSEDLAQKIDIKNAVLDFSKESEREFKHIKSIHLTYLDGHQTTFLFRKFDFSPELSGEAFKFSPPENTRVNRI